MQSVKSLVWWEVTLGLLVGTLVGTINGLREIAANGYSAEGLTHAALYAFQYTFNHYLVFTLAATCALCVITALFLLSRDWARSLAVLAGLGLMGFMLYRMGYNLNRYDFKPYWLKRVSVLRVPLPAGLVEPRVVLINLGLLAISIVAGWICYKVVVALLRRTERLGIRVTSPSLLRWLVLASVLSLIGFNAFTHVYRLRTQHRGPNIILISLDTLRADHLGCYGYSRNTSPNIDRFASTSVLFENAITQSGWTLPSHKSVLTSLDPPSLRVGENRKLDFRRVTISEILLDAGYTTGAFAHGLGWITPVWNLQQGFATFVNPTLKLIPEAASAEVITDQALRWLKKHRTERCFLFLHYGDIHSDWRLLPYEAPEPYGSMFVPPGAERYARREGQLGGSQYLRAINEGEFDPSPGEIEYIQGLYDGGIRYTDVHFGRLIEGIERLGPLNETMVIVFSDHGEEFREHGNMLHGWVYRETAHVPLLMHFPEKAWSGYRIEEQVRLVDIVPTILDCMGLPARTDMTGESLIKLVSEGGPARRAFTEGGDTYSVRAGGWMFLHALQGTRKELYNTVADPHELHDVLGAYAEREAELAGMLFEWIRVAEGGKLGGTKGEAVKLDRQTEELLKSLGYLHSGD